METQYTVIIQLSWGLWHKTKRVHAQIFEGVDRGKESRLNNDLVEVDLKMG